MNGWEGPGGTRPCHLALESARSSHCLLTPLIVLVSPGGVETTCVPWEAYTLPGHPCLALLCPAGLLGT